MPCSHACQVGDRWQACCGRQTSATNRDTVWQHLQLLGPLHRGVWEPPAVFKPHEAVRTVPVGAGQPHLCSIGLDRSSSPLAFALCGCHSYKISLSPIPPLHGGGAQTHFRPGQTLRSPQDCTGNTSLAPYFLEHSKGPISLTRMNDLDFILESVFTYSMPSSVTDTIRAGIISQAR